MTVIMLQIKCLRYQAVHKHSNCVWRTLTRKSRFNCKTSKLSQGMGEIFCLCWPSGSRNAVVLAKGILMFSFSLRNSLRVYKWHTFGYCFPWAVECMSCIHVERERVGLRSNAAWKLVVWRLRKAVVCSCLFKPLLTVPWMVLLEFRMCKGKQKPK